ncbi:MAG TPA: putative Ig domain-containing protein [Nitrospira sp.]|nr:putative Ig domain-containing protein [Nitrospira sp.]
MDQPARLGKAHPHGSNRRWTVGISAPAFCSMPSYLRSGVFGIPAFLLLFGCNNYTASPVEKANSPGGKTESHLPGIQSAEITPSPLTLNGPVSIHMTTSSLEPGRTSLKFLWYVNGKPLSGIGQERLDPEQLKKGDEVFVEIIPMENGQQGPTYRTASARVVNTPPRIKDVTLEPMPAKSGDRVHAKVEVIDPDHEDIGLKFKWWRNERLVSEDEDGVLDTTGYSRDDHIVVSVTPYDKESTGEEFYLQYRLGNAPPQIVPVEHPILADGRVQYAVKAVDPEHDPLSFSLDSAPPGMVIDERTGHISWTVPPGPHGPFRVKVMVKDNHGGWATQDLEFAASSRDIPS